MKWSTHTGRLGDGSINYAELKTTVAKIDKLRAEIDAIVAETEGESA